MKKIDKIIYSDKTPDKNSIWARKTNSGEWECLMFNGSTWIASTNQNILDSLSEFKESVETQKEELTNTLINLEESIKAQKEELFGDNSVYKIVTGTFKLYAHIPFITGVAEILPGDVLLGGTSEASYIVKSVIVETGSWAEGDAAGYIIITENASYLDAPYTDEEALMVGEVQVATMSTDSEYGAWIQEGDSPFIDSYNTYIDRIGVNHNVSADEVVSTVVSTDGTFIGYQAVIAALPESTSITLNKLSSDTASGVISGSAVDFTDLSNCTPGGTISFATILKTNN